jgi:hypothetical protein
MSGPVLELLFNKPPADLSKVLRDIADAVDAGKVLQLVIARIENDCYEFTFGASEVNCIVLSTLLHATTIDRMRLERQT